jgi:hypothetical protein
MEIEKQVPNITVNIRVPAAIFKRLEDLLYKQQTKGLKVSKNSMYVEALSIYLDMMEEIGVEKEGEDRCVRCGVEQSREMEEVGAGLTDLNGQLVCSKCFLAIIKGEELDGEEEALRKIDDRLRDMQENPDSYFEPDDPRRAL